MKILPQNQFRLLKLYKKFLPNINDATIFAYDNIIYSNNSLPEDLIIHEQQHFLQQKQYGLQTWVKRYLNEKDFRKEMERQAYLVQLSSISDEGLRKAVKEDSIIVLCSGLYGKITRQEAEKMLETKVKSKVDSLINL